MSEVSELQKEEPVVLSETIKQLEDTQAEVAKEIEIKVEEELLAETAQAQVQEQLKEKENETSKEYLDELKCIEQEMAEIKRGEPASSVDDNNEIKPNVMNETDTQHNNEGGDASYEKANSSLGRDDLIAMLKGDEELHDKHITTTATFNEEKVTEDVTIEGEGSFQIMEVVDDDIEGDEDDAGNDASLSTTEIPTIVATVAPKLPLPVTSAKTLPLTLEQQRAIAMEQMQDICAKRLARNKIVDTVATETKEKKETEKNMNLLQVLGADWSDDDVANHNTKQVNDKLAPPPPTTTTILKKPKLIVKDTAGTTKTAAAAPAATQSEVLNKTLEKPVITSVVLLNQSPNNTKIENGTEAKDKKKITKAAPNTAPVAQPSGFKRTRIVKRKIIWDPDAPETCISYAQLARVSAKPKPQPAKPATKQQAVVRKEAVAAAAAAVRKHGQVTIVKQESKSVTSNANDTATNNKIVPATEQAEDRAPSGEQLAVTVKKLNTNVAGNNNVSMSPLTLEDNVRTSSPAKRRSHTPIANGSSANKKKKISELDRLMGDEGAINMINSVESELNKKKDVEETDKSTETSPKHNMRSRTVADKTVTKREAAAATQKPQTAVKAKRQPKPKASASWDYVYQQQASDEAMIIRRRSNSSYSSNASLHRLSLDGGASTSSNSAKATEKKPSAKAGTARAKATATAGNSNSPSTSGTKKSFEFAKPKNKAADGGEQKTNRRGNKAGTSGSNTPTEQTNEIKLAVSPTGESKLTQTRPGSANAEDKKKELFISVAVHKIGKVWQIEFNTKSAKFTAEMLKQIVDALNRLKSETECSVVVISTKRANFCQGIDLTSLMVDNNEKRKNSALEIATAVKLYLKTLATFTKPIIAAVNGNISGIGVTQLLLFDTVIAGDKSTFEASTYAKIGQVPEGYCLWNNHNNVNNNLLKKLLWYGEKVNAHDAHTLGLVYKIAPTNSVFEEAISLAKKIASANSTMYTLMKQQSIERFTAQVDAIFEKEFNTITEQWSSIELYEKLKKFKDNALY